MNSRIKSKWILGAAAVAGVALLSQSALATQINVTYAGSANFGSGGVGYASGSIAPNPNSSTSLVGVGLGGDSDTVASNAYLPTQFNSWCVDIYHWLSSGVSTYTVLGGSSLATELDSLRPSATYGGATLVDGSARVNDLRLLANEAYGSLHSQADSAAFQLAVWAITYGTANASGLFSLSTGDAGFRVDGATFSAYSGEVNGWLSNLGTGSGNYALTYLSDGAPVDGSTQDLVVFTSVPEPATLSLLGLGLFGVGLMRRRKPA